MMKLLKYDWKRNANTFLGMVAILAIAELLITWFGITRNWATEITVVLIVILYASAGIFVIVLGSKTFDHNIKAYHRRLLPVHPVWSVISSFLLCWIFILTVLAIMAVHGLVYLNIATLPGFNGLNGEMIKDIVVIFLLGVWQYSLFIIMIFLAIAIGAAISIRGKGGTWVGILTFFVIQYVIGVIEKALFGAEFGVFSVGIFSAETGAGEMSAEFSSENMFGLHWGAFAVEAVFMGLMVWLISYLINRKMEI